MLRRTVSGSAGLLTGVTVINLFAYIGANTNALALLLAAAATVLAAEMASRVWMKVSDGHRDLDRLLAAKDRRAADQAIVDAATAAQVQL